MNCPATYRDASRDLYSATALGVIAKRVKRYGNRHSEGWWCDADAVGVSMRRAMFFDLATGTPFRTYEWLPATPTLEIKIESACQGGFPGRFYVRSRREQNS